MKSIGNFFRNFFGTRTDLGSNLKGVEKADALLQEIITNNKVPGIGITVLKQGEKLLEKGYGYADMEEKVHIDPEKTIFRIASISKPIAATALAHMVYDGLIDLDSSFYTYVPYFPRKKWDFTIRQLAGHTAGIRGYRGTEYGLNKPYTIKQGIEIFKDDDLRFEPGTDYLYNSYDWVLISLAMQEVSGVPFEEYVRHKVLQPLGMLDTFEPNAKSMTANNKASQLTSFYSKNKFGFRRAIPVNNYFKLAGGGYLSTTKDIAKFGQAILDGNMLHKETLDQFLTSERINGKATYYGLGWQVSEDQKGRAYYGHIGNGVGGYSNFFVYPEQRMVIAILVNCTNPDIQSELDEVIDAVFDKGSLS